MPVDYPHYPRHGLVHSYFEKYKDHFGFRHTVTCNTSVEQASRDGGGWLVRTSGPDGERTCKSMPTTTGRGPAPGA